jgi:fatty acid desaturase
VLRFLYWNMNYHLEHHMFPMVPYYNLPKLHQVIKGDCPPAYPTLWATYREIIPTLVHQLRDPSYRIVRPLPGHAAAPHVAGLQAQSA